MLGSREELCGKVFFEILVSRWSGGKQQYLRKRGSGSSQFCTSRIWATLVSAQCPWALSPFLQHHRAEAERAKSQLKTAGSQSLLHASCPRPRLQPFPGTALCPGPATPERGPAGWAAGTPRSLHGASALPSVTCRSF